MPVLSAREVAEICGGLLVGNGMAEATTFVADSRTAGRSVAFAAINTGHDFVAQALSAGAPFAVVERDLGIDGTCVIVDDTIRALGALATHVRDLLDVRVVGITGSTGKTITKDLVAAALRVRYQVHATPGSYNAEIGLPLTVLSCPDDAGILVAELGARHPGDISDLCAIVRPDIGVVTGIGSTHLEEFGTREAIAATKSELLAALPADGLGIVPSDDDFVDVFAASAAAPLRTVGPGGQIRYRAERIDGSGRTHGLVWIESPEARVISVHLGVPNRALMRNAALAIAVADELDVDAAEAADALASAPLSSSRMHLGSVGEWTVIDDAYNSNPTSLAAALRSARELAGTGPAWAVLGPMAELGDAADDAHARMGRLARELSFDGLIVVGAAAAGLAAAAGDIAHRVEGLDEAADAVARLVPHGALVLVKASRSVGLDRLVELLGSGSVGRQT